MTILILLLLLFITAFFSYKKRFKTGIIFFVVLLIFIESVGSGFIPFLLLKPLQASDNRFAFSGWKQKNAIVVLGGGLVKINNSGIIKPTLFAYPRLYEALALYYDCRTSSKICHLIISGGDPTHKGGSEAETYKQVLKKSPVNPKDIYTESLSNNTYQNAEFTSKFLKQNQYHQVILVTSGFHASRAQLYFQHFGIQPITWPADYLSVTLSVLPLSINFTLTDIALHEYAGFLQFYLRHWGQA